MKFKTIKWMISIMLLLISVGIRQSYSKDLGVVGDVYPIKEDDFLEFIQQRIHAIQQNGQWEQVKKQLSEKVAKNVNRPKPNILPRTTQVRVWFYDPSITVPYDLTDEKGNVFAYFSRNEHSFQSKSEH